MIKYNKKPILIDGVAYDIVYAPIPCTLCPFSVKFCRDTRRHAKTANINGEVKVFSCLGIMSECGLTELQFVNARFKQCNNE